MTQTYQMFISHIVLLLDILVLVNHQDLKLVDQRQQADQKQLTDQKQEKSELLAFSKLCSHPQMKFTVWILQWTAINQTRSQQFECFIQKNCLQINFNQSVITNESFGSDWIEIKCIQIKFLFDWRQSIATFTLWILPWVAV